jgi:hypothetical protein
MTSEITKITVSDKWGVWTVSKKEKLRGGEYRNQEAERAIFRKQVLPLLEEALAVGLKKAFPLYY